MKKLHPIGHSLSVRQRAHFDQVWDNIAANISMPVLHPAEARMIPVFAEGQELKEQLLQVETLVMRAPFYIPVMGKPELHAGMVKVNRTLFYVDDQLPAGLFPHRAQAFSYAQTQGLELLQLSLLRAFDTGRFAAVHKGSTVVYMIDKKRFYEFQSRVLAESVSEEKTN
ncbi:hypothetical protein SAMN05444266_102230 [Chitinophaga jiangningensis]|uniref:Uncharacterized protein n=1 Tax=Chitinophaga jiangningensis TaxID=1419482 RepID=A0A1M6YAL5_9BACT|nr:hypothetical protein [Chitinophaga jiangningensis]SHL15314.1 hypothetical protein SAMN05444266_102230 [Chitinophaga jiangningensis]